ncbi:hypothetical protein CEXT_86381 [Caerostris extrusa]|uniref:Uncharacterized protein n=1 Tax=Caerostris extrusa TaxID=172846 RepID=A0AAV4XPZ2_CAEEX|nr:hypothetical protein CEXT_86381 [Caerostris extrusa]
MKSDIIDMKSDILNHQRIINGRIVTGDESFPAIGSPEIGYVAIGNSIAETWQMVSLASPLLTRHKSELFQKQKATAGFCFIVVPPHKK